MAADCRAAAVRLAYGQEASGELDDWTPAVRPSAAGSRAASDVDGSSAMDDGHRAAGSLAQPCCCWSIVAAGIHLSPVGQAPD